MRAARVGSLVAALGLLAAGVRAGDLAEVRKRGVLRVLVWENAWVELFALKPGPMPGFDREILTGFTNLQRIGLEAVTVPSVEQLIPALLAGKGDLIAGGLVDTEARRRRIDFTSGVIPTRHVVITRKPHRVVGTMEELRGERIGTMKGGSGTEIVMAVGVARSGFDDSFPTVEDMTEALRSGKVSALVVSTPVAVLESRKDPAIELGLFLGHPAHLAYGVPKGSPELIKALNEYITNLRRTTTWSRLIVKYFGETSLEILKRARGE